MKRLLLLGLLALAACSPGAPSGFSAQGGTINWSSSSPVGTAIWFEFKVSGSSATIASLPITVTGPSGWNNNQALSLSGTNVKPSGDDIYFTRISIPAVSGSYKAQTTINGTAFTANFNIDKDSTLPRPTTLSGAVKATQVTVSWPAITGAQQYAADLYQGNTGLAFAAGANPSFSFSGLNLTVGQQYSIDALSYSAPFFIVNGVSTSLPSSQFNISVASGSQAAAASKTQFESTAFDEPFGRHSR